MEMAARPFPSGKRATVSEAKLAYFEGDFERCLEICMQIRIGTLTTASEVALLSARAYLRMGRAQEALAAILETNYAHRTLDASLTAQMLLGTAQIRRGDPDAGIHTLQATAARSAGAHFAVSAEIAFSTALGYWAKRDIDSAEAFLERVDRRADIIHARALELAAWCQTARGNYRRSADYFILTLLRLDNCRAHDRAIVATAISTLSILAAELFDREIARVVEHRAKTMEWTSGLVTQQYVTLLHQALFAEFAGNTLEAYDFAMRAREIAPTAPFEVLGWGISAGIARNAGEACSAKLYAKRAERLLRTLALRELSGEERFSILCVAENCAPFDSSTADELFAAYWALAPVDKMLAMAGDPRLAADETFVAGVIAEARGDAASALRCYREAFEMFERIGYLRRAVTSALAIVKLNGDDAMRQFVQKQLSGVTNYVTVNVVRYLDERVTSIERHPVVATLPPAQRDVVVLICEGKSNKEIAALRNVGEQTIKNMLSKHVFPAFGVSSRAALVSACLGAEKYERTALQADGSSRQ